MSNETYMFPMPPRVFRLSPPRIVCAACKWDAPCTPSIVIPSARIVERLSAPVSVPRSEAGVVVTEKGAADLRGCSLRERERRMRAISGNS